MVHFHRNTQLTTPAIVARLKERCDVEVSVGTVRNAFKVLGIVWKRTRLSLKKRDEVRFIRAQIEIKEMTAHAERDKIILAFMDETGFALAQPNRSAWTHVGKCHKIDANRGKRLNVIGAMLSTGELFSVAMWKTTNSLLFTGFLGLLSIGAR